MIEPGAKYILHDLRERYVAMSRDLDEGNRAKLKPMIDALTQACQAIMGVVEIESGIDTYESTSVPREN